MCAVAALALPASAAGMVVGGAAPESSPPLQPIGDGGSPAPAARLLHRASVGLLDYSPARIEFGAVAPGSSSRSIAITLTAGRAPVTLAAATLTGADASDFELTSDGCSKQTLAVGTSCTIEVAFAPALRGRSEARLTIDGDAANAPTAIHLVGGAAASRPAQLDAWLRCRARRGVSGRPLVRCRVRGVKRPLAKRAHVRRMVVRRHGRVIARQRWWAMPVRRRLSARLAPRTPGGRYLVGVRLRAGQLGRKTLRTYVWVAR